MIDDEYDRTRVSDGLSRYGAYLARCLPAVADEHPDVLTYPIRWAAATMPVMSPGYLTWHDPIEDIELSSHDGGLGAEIVLRTEVPAHLTGWRIWEGNGDGNLVESWRADRVALGHGVGTGTARRAGGRTMIRFSPLPAMNDSWRGNGTQHL